MGLEQSIRILLYLRISVEDEEARSGKKDESNSITNQRDLLYQYIGSKPEFENASVSELCDDGYSGTGFERPAVKELLKRAGERAVDCIMVKDFSRFGRDYLTVSDCIDQIFPFLGIRFISVNDGYDSKSYDGVTSGVETGFQNVVYAYYSRDISEKEKSSKRAKALRGDFLGSFAPIGYQKDPADKNHLVTEETGAEIVRGIFKMAGEGLLAAAITKRLNADKIPTPSELKKSQGKTNKRWEGVCREKLWDISSVTRILRDERYLGKNIYGKRYCPEVGNKKTRKNQREQWIVVSDCHEPLVTGQEFRAAGDMLKKYAECGGRRGGAALFKGKIRCGSCGCALLRERKKPPVYRCGTRDRADGLDCMEGSLEEERLKEVVWQVMKLYCRVFLDKTKPDQETNQKPDEEANQKPDEETNQKPDEETDQKVDPGGSHGTLRKRIASKRSVCESLAEQKAVLYEKYLDGLFSREQYLRKQTAVTERQEKLKKELESAARQLSKLSVRDQEEMACRETGAYLSENLKRQAVEAFVDCIYVCHETAVRIEWLFEFR